MVVVVVNTLSEFNQKLREAGDKLVVAEFSNTWCGPCQRIEPVFEEISQQPENSDVVFLKVDTDEAADVAKACRILLMPTFLFYKKGLKRETLIGADEKKLKEGVMTWK